MKHLFWSMIAVGALVATSASGAILFSDNFDTENGGTGQNSYSGFIQWDVLGSGTGGSVDIHGNGFNDVRPGNGLYVDLDGSTTIAGGIETKNTITFNPGFTYTLEFDIATNNFGLPDEKLADVLVAAGVFSEQFSLTGDVDFTHITRIFTVGASTNQKLSFATPGYGTPGSTGYGMFIDNIVLNEDPSGVPEPSTFMLSLVAVPLFFRRVRSVLGLQR